MNLARRMVALTRRALALYASMRSAAIRLLNILQQTWQGTVKLSQTIILEIKRTTASGVVTLDVDGAIIRLLEVKGKRVTRWATISPDTGEVEADGGSDFRAEGARLKQPISLGDIKARKVIVSLSGLHAISRMATVSNSTEEPAAPQADQEMAQEVMPLPPDKLYLSWHTISATEAERRVLVVGMRRDRLDHEMLALKTAGIRPQKLELKTMALARAVNRKQAVILNMENSSFDVVVVNNGVAEIMHTTAWQPQGLTVSSKVEQLLMALELVIGFYNSRHFASPLDPATPLFTTGQMSGDLSLMEALQPRLKYPVETFSPPLEYPPHMPVFQYAVNMGLAMKRASTPGNTEPGGHAALDINLLPQAYKPWRPSTRQLYAAGAIIAALALLFPVFQVTSTAMDNTANLQAKFNALNDELQRRQLEIKSRIPLQQAVDQYHGIVDRSRSFSEDLEVINGEAEKLGIQVQSIVHEGKTIAVTAQAEKDDYVTFREYLAALGKSGRFSTPVPPPEGFPYTWQGTIDLEPKAGTAK